ncbi:MAG: phenylalanine--tRNA ligase subunit beta [Aquificaceae bacterium]
MKIPYSWLSEFLHIENVYPEDVCRELTLRSAETSLYKFDAPIEGVVFGRVLDLREHPSRKDLTVCTVNVGQGTHLKIVTGDLSVRVNDGVMVALPNSRVGDLCVSKREVHGVVSEGMLLSAKELMLETHSEGLLKVYEDIKPGTSVYELLGFGEYILEIEITPNRGDLLSIRGIARDISTILRLNKKEQQMSEYGEEGNIDISIEDGDCKRYRGAVIEDVCVKEAPLWIRRRLWQSGLRSVNSVVDITNYIMLRDGQPLHAFDLESLQGSIVVRSAKKGERILTLMGSEKELGEDNLVIADSSKPLAIAGIVGGMESSVTKKTKKILLESAYFDPYRIRRSSKLLNLQTESSYRFERGVDIEGIKKYQDEAIKLIMESSGGRLVAIRDVYQKPYTPPKVFLHQEKYRRYTGEFMEKEEVSSILSNLEIPNQVQRCGVEVYVPSHRSFDISRDVDIIEEILRTKNYNSLPSQDFSLPVRASKTKDGADKIRDFLAGNGLCEIISFSFEEDSLYEVLKIEKPDVEIINPLVKTQKFMRSSLLPSLIKACIQNQRQHIYSMGLFEVGRVYTMEGEKEKVGLLLVGTKRLYPEEGHSAYSLLSLMLDIGRLFGVELSTDKSLHEFMHPNVGTCLTMDDKVIGFLGQLHPEVSKALELRGRVFIGEMDIPTFSPVKQYRHFSKFPPVIRDITLTVDKDTHVDKLISYIKSFEKVEEVKTFSVYTGLEVGEGKKRVSFRLVLRSFDGSMSDGEANGIVDALISSLEVRFGARLI